MKNQIRRSRNCFHKFKLNSKTHEEKSAKIGNTTKFALKVDDEGFLHERRFGRTSWIDV